MPAIEEYFGAADHEPTGSQSDQVCEDRIKVVFGAGLQDVELQAKECWLRRAASAACPLRPKADKEKSSLLSPLCAKWVVLAAKRHLYLITSSASASTCWNVEAERLGGLEVDHQLEFDRLLDR